MSTRSWIVVSNLCVELRFDEIKASLYPFFFLYHGKSYIKREKKDNKNCIALGKVFIKVVDNLYYSVPEKDNKELHHFKIEEELRH